MSKPLLSMYQPLLPMSEAKSWEDLLWETSSPFESVVIRSIMNNTKYAEEEMYNSIMSIWQLYDAKSIDYYYVIYMDSDKSLQYMIKIFNLTENSDLPVGTYHKYRFAVSSTLFETHIKSKTLVQYQSYMTTRQV